MCVVSFFYLFPGNTFWGSRGLKEELLGNMFKNRIRINLQQMFEKIAKNPEKNQEITSKIGFMFHVLM